MYVAYDVYEVGPHVGEFHVCLWSDVYDDYYWLKAVGPTSCYWLVPGTISFNDVARDTTSNTIFHHPV